jgi:ATP-dependent Clp protease ATP-binding subunit ClpB
MTAAVNTAVTVAATPLKVTGRRLVLRQWVVIALIASLCLLMAGCERLGLTQAGKPSGTGAAATSTSFKATDITGAAYGKTLELTDHTGAARTLADFLFDDERAMVRIDMSEYMEKHSVSRLIGAPPGYVGYDEGGQLTEAVRRRPYAVVLLDEVEKAHPDVFNVLLQLLDDGRLTDGQGRTVDFSNVVLIMTSNLPGDPQNFFRPEFINRVDEIVRFRSLEETDLEQIVVIQLDALRQRLTDRRIGLEVTEQALAKLAHDGYDPVFGARPLKRLIQKKVGDRLAVAILDGSLSDGDSVKLDVADGEYVLA